MTRYIFRRDKAERSGGDANVRVDDEGSSLTELPLRLDLVNHSPTGVQWGYNGSGPAQLALALCAHALGDDARAKRCYRNVKSYFTDEHRDEFELTKEEVLHMVDCMERKIRVRLTIVDYRDGQEVTKFLDTTARVAEEIRTIQKELPGLTGPVLITRAMVDHLRGASNQE